MTLTDEQLNLAMCEARGWTGPFEEEDGALMGHHAVPGTEFLGWDILPDHVEGIEALGNMHEAEGELTEDECELYDFNLNSPENNRQENEPPCADFEWRYTARQRCIAWLRVRKLEIFQ